MAGPGTQRSDQADRSEETLSERQGAERLREFRSATLSGIETLERLGPNWNGYGSPPIDPEIIGSSRRFILSLPDDLVSVPQVVPMTRGRLQFEWHCGARHLELEFETATTIHYLRWDTRTGFEEEALVPLADQGDAVDVVRWRVSGDEDAEWR